MKIEVWMLTYTRRHGVDLSGHASEAEATRAAAELAERECTKECTAEIALQIQGHFALGNYSEAVILYMDHVAGETFETRKVYIEGEVMRGETVVENGNGVVHMVRAYPVLNTPGDSWCGRMFFWGTAAVSLPVGTWAFKAHMPEEPRFTTCLSCLGTSDGE